MSRKRVPLNQNECTDDFRIGVPFEQNLQMVINSLEDAIVYLIYGGQAVIKADICERYLPQFCEDYIVPIKYVGGYR